MYQTSHCTRTHTHVNVMCNTSTSMRTRVLVTVWHRAPVHTIREEQFNNYSSLQRTVDPLLVCHNISEWSDQYLLYNDMNLQRGRKRWVVDRRMWWRVRWMGGSDSGCVCTQVCACRSCCRSLLLPRSLLCRSARLVRLHSCLVVIQFTTHKLVCVSAASLYG
jgi:hypothetical protein